MERRRELHLLVQRAISSSSNQVLLAVPRRRGLIVSGDAVSLRARFVEARLISRFRILPICPRNSGHASIPDAHHRLR